MSADFQQPTALSEDSIVPQVLKILRSHKLFPDGLEEPALANSTLFRYMDLHNEVSLYLSRDEITRPVNQAVLTTKINNEIVSIEEADAINDELHALMVAEGRIG